MRLANLDLLERRLLEHLRDHGSLTVGLSNALSVAKSFSTTTGELATAKNHLIRLGYAREETSTFTDGDCVLRLTPAGEQLFAEAPQPKKPWWKFW